MADDDKTLVPVWTLVTENVRVPAITPTGPKTPERLAELRKWARPQASIEATTTSHKNARTRRSVVQNESGGFSPVRVKVSDGTLQRCSGLVVGTSEVALFANTWVEAPGACPGSRRFSVMIHGEL